MRPIFHRTFHFLRHQIAAQSDIRMHSPYVFAFMREVIQSTWKGDRWDDIEAIREAQYQSNIQLESEDPGAGNRQSGSLGNTFKSSVSPKKKCQFIARTARFLKAGEILELGTSAGISGAYLCWDEDVKLTTIEGRPEIFSVARKTFENLNLRGAKALLGSFDLYLKQDELDRKFDLIYIDGDHSYEGTKHYVYWALRHIREKGMILVDDIYWSAGMTQAWEEMIRDERVKLSIDMYQIGILSRNPDFLQAQHFKLRL